jgi:Ca-activated chloride channel family protein
LSLQQPLGLLGLLSLPLFLLIGWLGLRRGRLRAVCFSNLEVLSEVAVGERSRRGWAAVVFNLAALALLSLALARPVVGVARTLSGGMAVLVFDVSGSMAATDIRPTRLGAAEHAALRFVQRLPARTAVGIVAFSDAVHVLATPTTDRRLLTSAIELLYPGGATAIGEGLTRALQLIEQANRPHRPARAGHVSAVRHPSGRVLLLSDGANNWGSISPLQAAEQARDLNIPVDTIGLGTRTGTLELNGQLYSGPGLAPDLVTLGRIARLSRGHAYTATSSRQLTDTYQHLATTISQHTHRTTQATVACLAAAILLISAASLITLTGRPRLP